jgi:hypothetical protein
MLVATARARLLALGDFAHLHVRSHGEHLLIEQPGPPEAPSDRYAVLRLTPLGASHFGLSLRRHTGRWENVPFSGPLNEVLAEAVTVFGPWLEPERFVGATSETDN